MAEKPRTWSVVLGMSLVILLGVGIFAFTAKGFSARLQKPFNLLPARDINDISFKSELNAQTLLTDTKDTDQDGLPDVQELNVYKTSPFLEDSDSDGVSDKAEIDTGEDPNCPKGTDCRAIRLPTSREFEQQATVQQLYKSTVISRLGEMGVGPLGIPNTALGQAAGQPAQISVEQKFQSGQPAKDLNAQLPKSENPDEIKQFLISLGMEQSLLNNFTDEQIVQLYKEALKEVK